MTIDWQPSRDFQRQAVLWGMLVRVGLNLIAELANFIAYWQAEGKVFHQVQWEQKFARHLQRAGAEKHNSGGNSHAGLNADPTKNAAQRRMLAIREAQLRARGQGVDVLGSYGGNILPPVGGQKRLGTVGPMDCADWEFDQRPDEERL